MTLIGRGQVHVFERAVAPARRDRAVRGRAVPGDSASVADPAWLVGSARCSRCSVPVGEVGRPRVGHRAARRRDAPAAATRRSVALQRHFLSALLLWMERWYEATRAEQRAADDPDVQLYRRFSEVLERDYARHHDAPHYSDALGLPQAALSRALVNVTGRTTKELITDRRMLEAARLLRFSDMSVGEIAYRAGYGDQLYFSRALQARSSAEAPSAYRERMRGRAPDRWAPGRAERRGVV